MLSGPIAFAGLMFLRSFPTPAAVMLILVNGLTGPCLTAGLELSELIVKTDLNWSTQGIRLILSQSSLPPAFSGATPILSLRFVLM